MRAHQEKKNHRFDMSSSVAACSFAPAVGAPISFLLFLPTFFLSLFLFSFSFFLQTIKPLDPLTFSVGNQVLDREIHVLLCHCYKPQGHTTFSLGDPGLSRRHHDIQNLSFVNKKRHVSRQYKHFLSLLKDYTTVLCLLPVCPRYISSRPLLGHLPG